MLLIVVDVARFYNPDLGASNPYHHLPFFYSDLFDLGYEAVGELDPSLELIADWQARGARCAALEPMGAGRRGASPHPRAGVRFGPVT
jgi:hypothetical protein